MTCTRGGVVDTEGGAAVARGGQRKVTRCRRGAKDVGDTKADMASEGKTDGVCSGDDAAMLGSSETTFV